MKRFAYLALACLCLSPLIAVDFGFDLQNISAFSGAENTIFSQRDTVTAWFGATGLDYQLKIEGFYKFLGDFNLDGSNPNVRPFRFDFSNLYLQLQFPDLLGPSTLSMLQFGRFKFSDSSSRIFDGLSDGLFFRFNYKTLELSLQSAFTGLSAQQDANIIISGADFAQYQAANPALPTDLIDPNYFAPNRIYVDVKGKILELFERHDLGFEIIGQFDLRPTDQMHTGYAELSAEGRPLQWFKWKIYGIGEIWGDDRTSVSMAAGGRAQFSFPQLLGLVAVANVDWASGSELPFRQFGAINQSQVAQIYTAVFADTLTFNINLAMRPFQGMVLGATGYGVFRASTNAPLDPKYPTGGTNPYLGTEALINVDYAFGGELRMGLKGGAFFPNTSADAYGASALPRWLISFDFKLML